MPLPVPILGDGSRGLVIRFDAFWHSLLHHLLARPVTHALVIVEPQCQQVDGRFVMLFINYLPEFSGLKSKLQNWLISSLDSLSWRFALIRRQRQARHCSHIHSS